MRRQQPFVDTPEYIQFVRRVLKSLRQRGNYFDADDLPQLVLLARELNLIIKHCVSAMRHNGASWEDIGSAIGVTRQAAQQRWGADDGA